VPPKTELKPETIGFIVGLLIVPVIGVIALAIVLGRRKPQPRPVYGYYGPGPYGAYPPAGFGGPHSPPVPGQPGQPMQGPPAWGPPPPGWGPPMGGPPTG